MATNSKFGLPVQRDVQEFLIDREARNLTKRTIEWYTYTLTQFANYLIEQEVTDTKAITPTMLRRFILLLQERGYNAGGVRNMFCAVKAFLKWYGDESAPKDWENPLVKVKMPKRVEEIQNPISLDDFKKLLSACPTRTFAGDRDRAMLLFLLDSGVRWQEFTDMQIRDIDLPTGQVLVRSGKGRKSRIVFIGAKTRKALLTYLKYRGQLSDTDPLWVTRDLVTALSKTGIKEVLRRRAKEVGMKCPGLHEFRRAFAINYLRNGGDIATLQRLLGHANLAVIQKYLQLLTTDLADAHKRASVVDNL